MFGRNGGDAVWSLVFIAMIILERPRFVFYNVYGSSRVEVRYAGRTDDNYLKRKETAEWLNALIAKRKFH